MNRRFSSELLFNLRNHIPIMPLIEDILGMPTRRIDGYFRFACPDCNGFHTGVKPEKNLGRCFDCRKNFNTIDMVMRCRRIDFTKSVYFLKDLLPGQRSDDGEKRYCSSKSNHKAPCGSGEKTAMFSVGQILSQLATSCHQQSLPDTNPVYIRDIIRRIEILEQKLTILLHQINPE